METKRGISFSRGGISFFFSFFAYHAHNPRSRKNIWHAAPGVYFPKLLHFGNNVFIFSLEREIINNNIYIRGGGK